MRTASDGAQLIYAASQSRTILTFNTKDFVPLHEQWITSGQTHAGIIVSRRTNRSQIGVLIRLVENVLLLATVDDLVSNLRYLSEFDV